MNIKKFQNKLKKFNGRVYFDYSIKKLNWFNIGGNTSIFFKPDTLQDLISFLKICKDNENFFVLGAGSNVLFKDDIFEGIFEILSITFFRDDLCDLIYENICLRLKR